MTSMNVKGRRAFLAGGAAAAVTGVTPAGAQDKAPVQVSNGSLSRELKGAAQGGSTNVEVPPLAVRALSKMGFGARRQILGGVSANPDVILSTGFETPTSNFATLDDVSHFMALGSTDDERLTNYVEEQLNPVEDTELANRFAAVSGDYETLAGSLELEFSNRECRDFSVYSRPYFEVERFSFLSSTYTRWQLYALMNDFWHNHLNIFGRIDRDTYASWSSWDRDIIRKHTFGNFYEMIWDSARHVAMMRYLDNYVNGRNGAINENYCRELFELHCMGAENYAGNLFQFQVEALAENPYTALNDADLNSPSLGFLADPNLDIAKFYVDDDVLTAAQSMTGFRYGDANENGLCGSGLFETNESEHNNDSTKAVLTLGQSRILSNLDAETEGRLIVKLAAYHPGTATYVCRKLCRRFISDNPPQSIVDAAAETFMTHRKSGDQMKRVLRTILTSDEFKDASNWGTKTKRPYEYVVSAMRAAGCDYNWTMDDDTSNRFISQYNATGQRLFDWRTPDGYPDKRQHWEGSNNLVQCWRTIDWLLDRDYGDEQDRVMRIINITLDNLPGNPSPRQLVEFWCNWVIGFSPTGGWTGPDFTPYQTAPTRLGSAALQFFTQQGFGGFGSLGGQDADAPLAPADEPIARGVLGTDSFPDYWHRRILGLVKVILWSPQFMQR